MIKSIRGDLKIVWAELFVPGCKVMHNDKPAEVTVCLDMYVPHGYVPIRYDDAPFPYVVVHSRELTFIQ